MSIGSRLRVGAKSIAIAILFAIAGWMVWRLTHVNWGPGETVFQVTGVTKEVFFHVTAQDESAVQAGIFASPDRLGDLVISCFELRQVGAALTIPCPGGTVALQHAAVNSLRLGEDTRVDLSVEGKDLSMTLTQKFGTPPVVTLFADERTKSGSARKPLTAGEWTVEEQSPAVKVIFMAPRFDAASEEGGERLAPGKGLGFEREERSGFIGESGKLTLLLPGETRQEMPLHGDRLQVLSVSEGKVQSLLPVVASDGSLKGLHVDVTGSSMEVKLIDRVTGTTRNVALDFSARYLGRYHLAKIASQYLFGLLTSVLTISGLLYDLHLKRLDSREKGRHHRGGRNNGAPVAPRAHDTAKPGNR